MAQNINSVVVTGNLTKDPELRETRGDSQVCSMRIAVNGRRKEQGEWVDKPNYFDVTVFGRSAEHCANYLSKGRPVAVQGRLDWSEWEKEGQKRQKVQIIADSVQFLGGRDDAPASGQAQSTEVKMDDNFNAPAPATEKYEDIPF